MRRALAVCGLLALGLLAGCHTPGGAVSRTMTVEFESYSSGPAQKAVIAACGHLPGITVSPTAQGDPNVILDYTHATTRQYEALTTCLGNLQGSRPDLQIRALVPDDGLDT